jgi:hypothetical protein
MPAAPEIADADIGYAERLLFQPGESFDDERRAFIRRLDTLDLQAVPGSGKTTALLAKLLILERRLPFADGSGVLVLSHTNAALDEIKNRIGQFCPRLFAYPNFVGTIQSFVDQFFALPYYCSKNGRRPVRIHNDHYAERAERFARTNLPGFAKTDASRAKYYLNATLRCATLRFAVREDKVILVNGINGDPVVVKKPSQKGGDWTVGEKQKVLDWLHAFKTKLMKDGALCFDDAYFLADRYLAAFPALVGLLGKRFQYIFVDEMQDMGAHQHDLLERLFFKSGADCHYQRIGDRNQAIHNERDLGEDSCWTDRSSTLSLKNSLRLSPLTAEAVSPFALYSPGLKIVGLNPATLKPIMIVYNDATAQTVLRKFSAIVRSEIDAGKIPLTPYSRFSAIAWNTMWEGEVKREGRMRLIDYYPGFTRLPSAKRIDYPCLETCVRESNRPGATMFVREYGMVGVFLKILRLEGVLNPQFASHFTRGSLLAYLRDKHAEYYATFRRLLYQWCMVAVNGDLTAVVQGIRDHIPAFLTRFDREYKAGNEFVEAPSPEVAAPALAAPTNTVQFDGFEITVASVHAVKGQNHTATLYFESAYYADGTGAGAKSYESQRLAPQFLGQSLPSRIGLRVQQSAKMVYVGFSRPTHLLCFAVHKQRFDASLAAAAHQAWIVVEHY